MRIWLFGFLCAISWLGCNQSGSSGSTSTSAETGTPLILAAGVSVIDPDQDTYHLTTPADTPFAFHAVTRARGNTGALEVSISHLQMGNDPPAGGAESLALAGIVVNGTGLQRDGNWLRARGDGFARLTIQGKISERQVIALSAETESGKRTAIVEIEIGPASEINLASADPGEYAGVLEEVDLYSSDSWQFGLPTIAVSGDRTSMVAYEGDRADSWSSSRYEVRLQYDPASGAVTAGGAAETSADSGHWRDHEIASLFNVIALVHGGVDKVTVRISFDRGASFGQMKSIAGASGPYHQRLAQIAIAADYTLAITYWQTSADLSSRLYLVEGVPSLFDAHGSPSQYSFSDAKEIHVVDRDVTPLAMGVAYSEGGDLVIGYGYSWTVARAGGGWIATTSLRCAVREYGEAFRDTLVEEEQITGLDPSVSLIGKGDTLRIFYAYEMRDGVRLRTSDDAGRSFGAAIVAGKPGAYFPSVFAREYATATRVDLLYLIWAEEGLELHLAHWDDFASGAMTERRLTQAKSVAVSDVPPGDPVPGMGIMAPDAPWGVRVTQIGWFGYDAALDGDDLIVVVDEQTIDSYYCIFSPLGLDDLLFEAAGMSPPAEFVPAEPPPLAPGMTEPVDPPNPAHMHQLRLLRLD